ncbi:septum formation initiator family protein [Streptomyces sp. NPDC059479]|uniref:septum formation initiator family protein n=1 Tax=Streptomyces sp. NPDC059479 TaxID=3346848 RepID=UPI00367F43A3
MSGPAKQLKGRAARLAQLMPAGSSSAARTPFVLLVVLLLGGGLITLLLLNSSLNEGSFRLSELKKRTTDLTDEQQALQKDVDAYSAPYALERRARELGMVPGGSPAFLNPDGTVRGVAGSDAKSWAEPSAQLTQPSVQPSAMEQVPPAAPVPTPVVPAASATSAPALQPVPAPPVPVLPSATAPAAAGPSLPVPQLSPYASTGVRQAPAPAPGTPAPTTSGR